MNQSAAQDSANERYRKATLLPGLLLLIVTSLFQPQAGRAETLVPCGVPIELETWTAAGSPYLITCDVQVDSLTIQPGVTVFFLSNSVFRVTGFLHADGAANLPIIFTSTNSVEKWQGIFFEEVTPGSFLKHCVVEGSGKSGVLAQNCGLFIADCEFKDNVGLDGGAISINNTAPGLGGFSIVRSTFVGNRAERDGGAIHAVHTGGGSDELLIAECAFATNSSGRHGGALRANVGGNLVSIHGSSFLSNTANPPSTVGTYFGGGLHITGNSKIINSLIAGNVVNSCTSSGTRSSRGGGIYLDGNRETQMHNCVITNNTAAINLVCGGGGRNPEAYGGGIFLADGKLSLRNCVIAYNTLSGSINYAYGGGIGTGTGTTHLENCTIVYNTIVNVGVVSGGSGLSVGSEAIVHNSIVFFNHPESGQLTGTTNILYSNVQGGVLPGPGNKSVGPNLGPLTTNPSTSLRILGASQCVDAGDPDPIYNDLCFPPSRGTARNDMGAHGGPGGCCWIAPCACPVLGELANQATCAGMSVTFCATVTSAAPISYQWRYHGPNPASAPVDIAHATNACLRLSGVQVSQAGYYSVRISSPACPPVESNPAQLLVYAACFSLDLYPGLSITGQVGRAYSIQYTTDLSANAAWTSLTNFTLTSPEYFFLDPQPARNCGVGEASPPQRFYRVIE
jgi:hypothetical protein